MSNLRTAPLLCGTLLAFALSATTVDAAAPDASQPCCGIHDYEVDGVKIALMSVTRDNPEEITVRWQFRNTSAEARKIGESFHGMGSSEAFSLDWDAYVVDPVARIKYPVLKDDTGVPAAARHGGRKVVTLQGNQTLSVWAKFALPAKVANITVYLPGAEPFESVRVTPNDSH